MALSGTLYTNVGARWRLQLEWTATQNISANTSTVTARLYWMGLDQYSAVYASSADPVSITINGSSSPAKSISPGLSAGQKKLIQTHSATIVHDSDGTKSFSLSAFFDVNATLNGAWIARVHVSGSATLNTIPRASTVATTPSWTAGNNTTISVNRASSSFSHEADIYVKNTSNAWVKIKEVALSSSQTSVSSSFSAANLSTIFSTLAGRTSADTRVVLRTFSGSTQIGSTERTGTVTAPNASTVRGNFDNYWFTDESIYIPLSVANSAFTHTVRIELGSFSKTFTGVGSSVTWTPTAAEENSLGAQMPSDNWRDGRVYVDTFYNGNKVRSTTSVFIQFHIRDAAPIFTGTLTYADTDTAMTAITGNNQYIVQGKSNLVVTMPSGAVATAKKGASLVSIIASVAGESITIPYSTGAKTFDFGTINGNTNQSAIVEVVDSRGNRSQISKIVTIVPYSAPTLATSAERTNGFEEATKLSAVTTFSPITIGTAKNSILNMRYRTRLKNGSWGSYSTFNTGTVGNKVTAAPVMVDFAITSAYEVEFTATDRFGSTTAIRNVGVGRPIFFIDDMLGSIAMNDFPKDPNTFLLNGTLTFAGNMYASSTEGGGAIFLNNGDITGANGIWFNDVAGNSGEGLLFPKTGIPVGSKNRDDYDNFYVRDGRLYLNNVDFMDVDYGSASGSGVRIGAGGLTIIGSGESSFYVKQDSGDTNAAEQMHVSSDNDVIIWAGANSGLATAKKFVFDRNGILRRDVNKESNGYNTVTFRDDVNHDDPMLIQSVESSMTFTGADYTYVDVSWGTAFNSRPVSVSGVAINAQSLTYNMGIYTISATGCRVYLRRVDGANTSASVDFMVTAIGRRA